MLGHLMLISAIFSTLTVFANADIASAASSATAPAADAPALPATPRPVPLPASASVPLPASASAPLLASASDPHSASVPLTTHVLAAAPTGAAAPTAASDCSALVSHPHPKFKMEEIEPRVYSFSFGRRTDMGKAFVRIQEYYESPEFRDKTFSLAEFKRWYRTTTSNGTFTYFSDWEGYNFPEWVLKPFQTGRFPRMSVAETEMLAGLPPATLGKFYVIAAQRGDEASLGHELAHAHFYLNADYRREMEAAVASEDTSALKRYLLEAGYSEATLVDEIHAYILYDWDPPPEGYEAFPFVALKVKEAAVMKKYYPELNKTRVALQK